MGGPLQTTPMQVLAPNVQLESAANNQSSYLLASDEFSHTGAGGTTLADRVADAGYRNPLIFRENLSAAQGPSSNLANVAENHHNALYESASHRAAIFDENQGDIGIGIQEGQFRGANTSMLTEVFGAQIGGRYVTGVTYADNDRDDFYSTGEGLSEVDFQSANMLVSSANAGGYALNASGDSTSVSIIRDGITLSTLSIDTSEGNAKLDLVLQNNGGYAVAVSKNTTLISGISDASLLGAGNLNLIGHSGANFLEGNGSKNKLRGNDGDDVLKGYAGRDKLLGGADEDKLVGGGGKDKLKGGSGDDVLKGGGGADSFFFNSGQDVIRDFKDDVDTIIVEQALINGSGSTVGDLLDMGEIINGNAVFDLSGSHQLTVQDVTDLDDLRNDLIIG